MKKDIPQFGGSTLIMASMMGINQAAARSLLIERIQSQGCSITQVQAEYQEISELEKTGLEVLVEVVHNLADPLVGLVTAVAIQDVKDAAKNPEVPKKLASEVESEDGMLTSDAAIWSNSYLSLNPFSRVLKIM